jgi:hypothetical protein
MKTLRALAVVALAGTMCTAGNASPPNAYGKSKTSVWFQAGPGRASRVFTMRQPGGMVRLTRLTTTYGIRASAAAMTVPRLAGVRVVNWDSPGNPAPCRRRGSLLVCTQSHEGCPMPKAVWRIHLLKTGGPAGLVRFDFVVR